MNPTSFAVGRCFDATLGCGHCKKMAPAYDAAAVELGEAVHVVKVDATRESHDEGSFLERVGVKGYPTVKLFREGKVYQLTGKKRDQQTIVDFAAAGFIYFGHQEYEANEDGKLVLKPKPPLWRAVDAAHSFLSQLTRDVKEVCKTYPLVAVALFGSGFLIASFALIITEVVSEWLGLPRRGETLEDVRDREQWLAQRAELKAKKTKADEKKAE